MSGSQPFGQKPKAKVTLFSLVGTTYGGDGKTTFALPTAKPVFTADGRTTLLQCISEFEVLPTQN